MSCRACSTCEHWKAREPAYAKGPFGVCSLPDSEDSADVTTYVFVDDGPYGEGGSNLWTRCDFSCQLYKAKETA